MDKIITEYISSVKTKLLEDLIRDYNLPNEIVSKYDSLGMCTSLTIKGDPCKNPSIEGCSKCKKHLNSKPKPEKEVKEKKVSKKKVKRTEMVHNHRLGEVVEIPCTACLTWGNPLDVAAIRFAIM